MVLSLFTAILECDVIWSEAGTRAVPTTLEPKWLRHAIEIHGSLSSDGAILFWLHYLWLRK